MNLLYITFGKDPSIHLQALYSMASFLKKPSYVKRIIVITDEPELYTIIREHINLEFLSEKTFNEWKGPHNFFWRIKIKGIEWAMTKFSGEPILYADTDTFLSHSAHEIALALQENSAFMHENEGPLALKKSKTEKKMWRQVIGQQFGGHIIKKSDSMWNAGFIAFPNTTNGQEIQLALNICDEMCAKKVITRLIEQFSLSLALAHFYPIKEAKKMIVHYWSAKSIWNKALMQIFSSYTLKNYKDETVLEKLCQLPLNHLPTVMYEKNTARRLKNIIDKIFPSKTS